MDVDKEVNSPAIVMELGKELVSFDEGEFMLSNFNHMYVLTIINSGGSKAENVVSKAKKKTKKGVYVYTRSVELLCIGYIIMTKQ